MFSRPSYNFIKVSVQAFYVQNTSLRNIGRWKRKMKCSKVLLIFIITQFDRLIKGTNDVDTIAKKSEWFHNSHKKMKSMLRV